MLKILFTLMLFVCINLTGSHAEERKVKQNISSGYAESVHMYICIEALKLLKDAYPQSNFSQIENRIGTMDDIGSAPWQVGKITTGSYREDLEDVVFDIRGPFNWYVSNSHFWNADNRTNGDHSLTGLSGVGDYPNSYTKITKFLNGQWFQWSNGYHGRLYINYLHIDGLYYRFSYHTRGLINFFRTKIIFLHSKVNVLGQEIIVDEEIVLSDYVFHKIVWEVLGRMAHHIQDNSVPSHSHNDVHIPLFGGDCYHNFIDDGAYTQFNWLTAKNTGGLINPYVSSDDPLRYLLYSANQLADHYPSGPDCNEIPQQHAGDNNLPGGTYPIIDQYYQQLGPPPLSIINLYQEASVCFNYAIRATAGLFYWFAVETGMISPGPGAFPVIHGFTRNLPDLMIYRGETLKIKCNASGSNLNYNWFYKPCSMNNWCILPINGLSFNQNDNEYSVTNFNFSNHWTCHRYDSLCNAENATVNELIEDPLKLYTGVTVSNQFGQVNKFYNMNTPLNFTPINAIRAPYPPVRGCPILHTKDTNGFKCENNILIGSVLTVNQGKDTEDKLVITNLPYEDEDNTLQFAVTESDNEYNYFDNFRLEIIDHPMEYNIVVTSNNDIALTDLSKVRSPETAEKNGLDIKSELKYDSAFAKFVTGEEKEIIHAGFSKTVNFSNYGMKGIKDSFALILDPFDPDISPSPVAKREIGYISVIDTAGNKITNDIDLLRRQRRSARVIPVSGSNDVSEVTVGFKQGFALTYLGIVNIFYGGYNKTELELAEAENSLSGSVYKELKQDDKVYAEMDSTSFIVLKFKDPGKEIPDGWVRDYVLTVRGKTIEPDQITKTEAMDNATNKKEINNTSNKFSLDQNFPNPFNTLTVITYSLPVLSNVSIKIYDLLGKEVASLVNQKHEAGKYSVRFDGSSFSSGIYYYKITSGIFNQIRKMILIK